MLIEVINQYLDLRRSERYARYLQVTGLKQGSVVEIYRPWTGVKLDEGVEKDGLFVSKIEYKEGRRYQVVVRKAGYESLSVRTESRYTTVRMKKDLFYG